MANSARTDPTTALQIVPDESAAEAEAVRLPALPTPSPAARTLLALFEGQGPERAPALYLLN